MNLLFAAEPPSSEPLLLLHDSARTRCVPRLDLPGTLLASGGLFGLVFGFSHAATDGWLEQR